MQYEKLGDSGVSISNLALGTMTFGDGADIAECQSIYTVAREAGINHFDCANVYANGESECILGSLINAHREEVVISTKVFYPTGALPNDKGLGRRHMSQELHRSLLRLNTEYIDIYYLHAYDGEISLRETLATLDIFTQQGKILYVGISNFAAWQVMKLLSMTNEFPHLKVVCIQPMYNLLKRQCEVELLPMASHENLGVIPYGPLAGGVLTGKYLNANTRNGRLQNDPMYRARYADEKYTQQVTAFIQFAKTHGYSPEALAIAWVSRNPIVSAPLLGAKSAEQLKTALASGLIQLSEGDYDYLTKLIDPPGVATDRSEELA